MRGEPYLMDAGGPKRRPWLAFIVFTLGQAAAWKGAPLIDQSLAPAGPATWVVVQDIVAGFDVTSFFASPFWAIPFGLFWFVPMYLISGARGLVLPALFGAFLQVYLHLMFAGPGEYFGFLSDFRYPGSAVDTAGSVVQLAVALFRLFAGPVILAFVAGIFRRA